MAECHLKQDVVVVALRRVMEWWWWRRGLHRVEARDGGPGLVAGTIHSGWVCSSVDKLKIKDKSGSCILSHLVGYHYGLSDREDDKKVMYPPHFRMTRQEGTCLQPCNVVSNVKKFIVKNVPFLEWAKRPNICPRLHCLPCSTRHFILCTRSSEDHTEEWARPLGFAGGWFW